MRSLRRAGALGVWFGVLPDAHEATLLGLTFLTPTLLILILLLWAILPSAGR
jgi:hypothetical protein